MIIVGENVHFPLNSQSPVLGNVRQRRSAEDNRNSAWPSLEKPPNNFWLRLCRIPANIWKPINYGVERDLHFLARDVLANARMRTATESEIALNRPENIILVGVFPTRGITIRGAQTQMEQGTLGNLNPG